jgi:hypothetical protein
MEHLMALSIEPGDHDSASKSLAALKSELAEEKVAQEKAQAKVETLARTVGDLKKTTDGLAAKVPFLEEKVKLLDNKVLDGLTEIRAKKLSLERTTKANEDYKSQNTRLTKKLESKLLSPWPPRSCILLTIILTLLQLTESNTELNIVKAMVENAVAFFYPTTLFICLSPTTSGRPANSIPRGDPCQHEAVSESNPWDPKVPLSSSQFGYCG